MTGGMLIRVVVAVVLVILAQACVTRARGWAVPAPALVPAIGLALAVALGCAAIRLARGFRSSPYLRPAGRGTGGAR